MTRKLPRKILADAGVVIRSPKFWQGGFDMLSRMADELEKLPVEKQSTAKKKVAKVKPVKKKSKK